MNMFLTLKNQSKRRLKISYLACFSIRHANSQPALMYEQYPLKLNMIAYYYSF